MQPTAAQNWQQQQQPQQQQQQQIANSNLYSQYTNTANNWQTQMHATSPQQPVYQPQQQQNYQQQHHNQFQHQQQQQQQVNSTPTYNPSTNYFDQQQSYQQQTASNYIQQSLPTQNIQQTTQLHAEQLPQPQPQPQQQQTSTTNQQLFDNNSNTNRNDGWGDWDWNDNSNSNLNDKQPSTQQNILPVLNQQSENPLQSVPSRNINVIEDSFSTQSNDNWNWGTTDDSNLSTSEQPVTATQTEHLKIAPTPQQVPIASEVKQDMNTFHVPKQQNTGEYSIPSEINTIQLNHQTQSAQNDFSAKPTTLPLVETRTDNINITSNVQTQNTAPTAGGNIPNSVYVSQAKPVSRPPRQFASPPDGNTPVEAPDSALLPPHGFQNDSFQMENSPSLPQSLDSTSLVQPQPQPQPQSQPPPPPLVSTLPTAISPPSVAVSSSTSNPFKRTGIAQHHRAGFMPTTETISTMPQSSFNIPPPPADFANPAMATISGENYGIDNSEDLHENQEVIMPVLPSHTNIQSVNFQSTAVPVPVPVSVPVSVPLHQLPLSNNERNQYMQTSPLSENPDEEVNVEGDNNLPPPGLSRLVLGEPELETPQRMVTGTEEPVDNITNLNIEERHADGQDTSVELVMPPTMLNSIPRNTGNSGLPVNTATNIGITTDRNLYLVPGESNAHDDQRVVTGVETTETIVISNPTQVISEQREIELDGENLDDQQPLLSNNRDEPPLVGAASNVELTVLAPTEPADAHHTVKSKEHSNVSTGNDDSDLMQELHHNRYATKNRKRNEIERRNEKQYKEKKSYESDESEEYSSDRERNDRRRGYREGSVRSDRGRNERSEKERNRRSKRDGGGSSDHERTRDKYYRDDGKSDRRKQRYNRNESDTKYDAEESMRHDGNYRKDATRRSMRENRGPVEERSGRSDRSDRDYDDYNRRQRGSKRGEKTDMERDRRGYTDENRDRRQRRDRDRDRERDRDYDYDTVERRRREKHHQRGVDPRDYEEYRKQSSRNARGSDLEKDRTRDVDARYDSRHGGMYGYHPTSAYGYDSYAYYYEQMARNNPQAYAEWYKKYYAQAAATTATAIPNSNGDSLNSTATVGGTDGRESVHSGRSSAHNEKNRYTQAYISQANEYHRHFHHHHQQQQQKEMARIDMSLNSTMLDESISYTGLRSAHSTSNISQISSTAPISTTGYYIGPNRAYFTRSDYTDLRSANVSLARAEQIVSEQQRLTPFKFLNEHAVATLGAGVLVTVKPKITSQGNVSHIVKLQRPTVNDASFQFCQSFPGPLVRGLTHKKTIIEFCEEQIRLKPYESTIYAKQLMPNAEKYRASYTLMWNLLILLVRQNGMVVGTDIAELLLKNQQLFPYVVNASESNSIASNSVPLASRSNSATSQGSDNDENDNKLSDIEIEQDKDMKSESNLPSKSEVDLTTFSAAKSSVASETEITNKFRNYLLYGNVNEALDWATDNNLWGHALFLASKVDRRSHANVMMKFANKLSLNDPLQTLYQLMSGRTPSSVTSVQDEKWGDWRPHLSMILSNTSQKPELDRKAITTLGDSLFNRGDLFAAHFCYLMAQVGFGRYQESASQETTLQQTLPKLVLLGSSHYKNFHEFATNEAIVMTEIYEYACSLNDDKFSLVEFQPYKYLLATRMLDYGFHLKSLMYMEQISLHIQRDPSKYEPTFINKVYELADRLKYYDPVLDKTIDEQQNTDDNLNNGVPNFEEQKWLQDLRTIAAQYNVPTNTLDTANDGQYNYQNQIDQQFVEINKQFNELNLQYSNNNTDVPMYQADQIQQQQQQQQHQPTLSNLDANEQYNSGVTDYINQQQYAETHNKVVPDSSTLQPAVDPYNTNYSAQIQQDFTQQQQQLQQQQLQQQQPEQTNLYYDPTLHQQQYNNADVPIDAQQSTGSYDYWSTQQQQIHDEFAKSIVPENNHNITTSLGTNITNNENNTKKVLVIKSLPTRKKLNMEAKEQLKNLQKYKAQQYQSKHIAAHLKGMSTNLNRNQSNALTKSAVAMKSNNARLTAATLKAQQQKRRTDVEEDQTPTPFLTNNSARPTISMPKSKSYDSDDEILKKQKQQQQQQDFKTSSNQAKNAQQQQQNKNEGNKTTQQSNQNSGWFGGIWNKLSLKPKNQMILPDDKNPSIVWDPDKKRWVNTDGDENGEESFKPPPKMSDIMPQQMGVQQPQPQPQSQLQLHQQPQPQQQMQPQPQLQQPQQQQLLQQQDIHQYNRLPTPMPTNAAAAPINSPNTGEAPHNYSAAGIAAASTTTTDVANAAPKPPSLQSNMFKMQRNRTLKNSYVDVFNPSGAPMSKAAENVLAPTLPPVTVPAGGYFIPGATPTANDGSSYQQQEQQVPQQDVPQFYNPNQYGAGY
ncbi:uncharacterized protein LOC119669065 isoform X2 [Teleopsis dalmanni]|nr:uncharacterized protein LOC119669065 isoform X2 [Teleopsis dalmanni]